MDKKKLIQKIVDFAIDKNFDEENQEQWFVDIDPNVKWVSVYVYLFSRDKSDIRFDVRYNLENTDKQYEYFLKKTKELDEKKKAVLEKRENEIKEKEALVERIIQQGFNESNREALARMSIYQLRELAGKE